MLKPLSVILLMQILLIFALSLSSMPLSSDMVENLIWGRTLDFASDKHPPFFAWESYLSVKIAGGKFFLYNLLMPIHQAILLLFIYLLAKKILQSKNKAMIATILAQGIIFHVFYFKFNANTANYGFFGAIYYYFYIALKEEKYQLFLPIGLLCAVVMLIKYSAILLIASLGITLLITPEGRKAFKSLFLYLGCVIFIFTLTPYIKHVIHNLDNNGVMYLLDQTLKKPSYWFELPEFIIKQIAACLPLLITFYKIKTRFIRQPLKFDTIFLITNTLLPFFIVICFIVFTKSPVGFYWMSMFYSLMSITVLYFWNIKENALKITFKRLYPIVGLLYLIYYVSNMLEAKQDVYGMAKFLQKVNQNNIQHFICNDSRAVCGSMVIYSKNYQVQMPVSLWKDPFSLINAKKDKPLEILIIGEEEEINLPNYTLQSQTMSFQKIYKINKLSQLINKIDKNNSGANTIILTIATLKP